MAKTKRIRRSHKRRDAEEPPPKARSTAAAEDLSEPASPVCYLSEFEDLSALPAGIQIKRAYEPPAPDDGTRILIDRLWPRGVKRSALAVKAWLKEVAPSTALRQWFHKDPKRWNEFQNRYRTELRSHPEALKPLYEAIKRGRLTLVYGARDTVHNHAVVLREFLFS